MPWGVKGAPLGLDFCTCRQRCRPPAAPRPSSTAIYVAVAKIWWWQPGALVATSRNHCGPAEAEGSILERRQVDSRMTRRVVTCRKQGGCRDLWSCTAARTRNPGTPTLVSAADHVLARLKAGALLGSSNRTVHRGGVRVLQEGSGTSCQIQGTTCSLPPGRATCPPV